MSWRAVWWTGWGNGRSEVRYQVGDVRAGGVSPSGRRPRHHQPCDRSTGTSPTTSTTSSPGPGSSCAHALHSTPWRSPRPRNYASAERTYVPGAETPLLGRLEREGEVHAAFYRLSARRHLNPTSLTPERADTLAAHLAGLGRPLSGVVADHTTADAFAKAWERRTGATPVRGWGARPYRLGTLTPPEPIPEGRGRAADEPRTSRGRAGP
jgi:hypothetical protein